MASALDNVRALLGAGQVDAAAALLGRILSADPGNGEALYLSGRIAGHRGDAGQAIALYRRAIAARPDLADAHRMLGSALGKRGDFAGASASAERAVALAPADALAQLLLGQARFDLGDHAGAVPPLREAIRLRPRDGAARRLLGRALIAAAEFAAAERELQRATADAPGQAEGWLFLAVAQRALGRLDGAAAALRRALALEPDNAEALRAMAVLGRGGAAEGELDRLRGLLGNPARAALSRAEAGFALGKLLDDADRYDEAFAAFAAANAFVHAEYAAERFDAAAAVAELTGRFDAAALAGIGAGGDASELPVFIVGMPRSGTSLVEQIAASHSRVFGAGELTGIAGIARALRERGIGAARAEADGHLRRLRALGGEATRVIDKLPDNIFNLGAIAAVYPGARVVLVRRDPRDTCLSCYFQRFTAHSLTFAYDLAECGERAVAVDRLAEHWRGALPLRLLELGYEELVADLEGQGRRLIEFLGLDWEPACLEFHRTERTVATASFWQVRQPIYGRSVGRWRHYERHLGELLAALRTRWPEL